MKRFLTPILASIICLSFAGCTPKTTQTAGSTTDTAKTSRSMILSTTTSTQDSGLLDYLLPYFEKDTGIKVNVVAKGTGEALAMGKNGDADCLLVHAKAQELQFVKDGYGINRHDVMYNDFIIVGPKADPAGLKKDASNDAAKAFKNISDTKAVFISRGDNSGTNTKELAVWKTLNIEPKGSWYLSAGKGMGEVLQMANEKQAYTLTDRATYLSMKDKLNLEIVTEKSKDLLNQYGVMIPNPKNHNIKEKEGMEFVNWIISDKAQKLIADFGKAKFNQSLFIPDAN
ncbi:substrate-binding domain-containing protein [Candidatus Clostridium radicumherbarum]|uniref:Substrate-binding domain-containing protein n=1 Tax=Candidatus Clostridium radicumherbarum TaxID=3381662 RepID=A0ABW8TSX3_9CLOT